MKIGLVLDHFDPQRGGVEQWTYQFARKLLQRGHEVHVIAAGFGEAATSLGITAHQFDTHRSSQVRAQAAQEVLQTLPLDVIHDMGIGWFCDLLQPHGGSRQASFEQNLQLLPPWQRPAKRLLARVLPRYREFSALAARQYAPNGPLVLALSEMVRKDLHRYHDVADERIRLIYNGVDTDRFSPELRETRRAPLRDEWGVQEDEVVFLIVAHNFRLKGVPALLQAMTRLSDEAVKSRLVIAGGKRFAPFRREAKRLGVAGRVHFAGAVADAAPYYAAADVYVQPTFYDPCSLVVLEALACGLPVITTRFNGAGELLTEGEHGYVLDDPADVDGLALRMSHLLSSERRRMMARTARQLALQHSFDRNVAEILHVYEQICDARRPNARAA